MTTEIKKINIDLRDNNPGNYAYAISMFAYVDNTYRNVDNSGKVSGKNELASWRDKVSQDVSEKLTSAVNNPNIKLADKFFVTMQIGAENINLAEELMKLEGFLNVKKAKNIKQLESKAGELEGGLGMVGYERNVIHMHFEKPDLKKLASTIKENCLVVTTGGPAF